MKSNLYFNSKHLPTPQGEFVVWCDCMGTGRCLARSLHRAANSVFRLHTAFSIAQAKISDVRCYPVMDGIYITSPSRNAINHLLRNAFCELAREFIFKSGTAKMHMVRAAVAFGPTLHGADISEDAFFGVYNDGREIERKAFEQSALNRDRLQVLLSPAMILAYNAETRAPPFGVYVDDTAKCYPILSSNSHGSYTSSLWQWWILDDEAKEVARALYNQILFYLSKAETHSVGMSYIENDYVTSTEDYPWMPVSDSKSIIPF